MIAGKGGVTPGNHGNHQFSSPAPLPIMRTPTPFPEHDMRLNTLNELFTFNTWGHELVLSAAAPLSDAQLDQPFEMGPGSLRATLNHLYSAERVWLDRWKHIDPPRPRPSAAGITVAQLQRELPDVAAERRQFLERLTDTDLPQVQPIKNMKGEVTNCRLDDMLLHVCNHAIHHRAQAANMIKRGGGKPPSPGADYIFMRVERISEPAPDLDLETIRAWLEYADWARARVATIAAPLSNEQLDRPFEIGPGSLRRALLHVTEAEQWWWGNWQGQPETFPDWPTTISMTELQARADELAAKRNRYLQSLNDADLKHSVKVVPRPGRELEFPIGPSLLQICCHGTHHRAQAINMLRHVGATVPTIDYITMRREQSLAATS